MNLHRSFLLLTASLYIFFVATQLVQDGMFTDGLLYISVAKNLALGKGTFWNPVFSETLFSSFHQQPPLFIFIESLFFRALGTGIHVERIYCFVVLLISIFLMIKIWSALFTGNKELQKFYWLPLLFFILIPRVGWAYSNNVAEGTMGVFDLLAVYLTLRFLQHPQHLTSYVLLILSACSIFFASLCKGFPGLFPMVTILCYWAATRRISFLKSLGYTAPLVAIPCLLYTLLLLDDTILQSFKDYFDSRLYSTFNHTAAATTANRFRMLWRLLLALLPIAGCTAVIIFLRKRIVPQVDAKHYKEEAIWMLLIGLSGSLPLMITLEQRNFYMATALPYFAFAFGCLAAPRIAALFQKWQPHIKSIKLFQRAMIVVLLASVITTAFLFGNIRRDKEMLADIYSFGKSIPPGTVIKVTPSLWKNWSLHGYFMRHYDVSLYDGNERYSHYIIENGRTTPDGYLLVQKGKMMDLYELPKR